MIGSVSDRELQRALRGQKGSLLVNTGSKFKRTPKEPAVKLVGLLPHFRLTKRPIPRREGEEMDGAGVSTDLELYPDPWKIKKKLTSSDVGHLSRLLLGQDCVRTHVFPQMGEEMVRQVKSRDGMKVAVWDADTGAKHRLVFRYWASSKGYVLNGGWNKLFVKGRGLEKDDEIGMLWIPSLTNPKFIFKLLRKADRRTSNAAA